VRPALVVPLVLALAAAACRRSPSAFGPGLQGPVVRRGPLEDRFTLTGTLEAKKADVLRVPKTPTWMLAIKWIADDGALVKKGDRVVEFDTSSLSGTLADRQLAVQRAETELASDAAKNATTEGDKRIEVERKRVALQKAEVEAAIPADLRPRREHQEKQLAAANARDALEKAEQELTTQRRSGQLDHRIREVALTRAARELEELESRLEELTLRAPRDGLVQVGMNFRDGARKFQMGDSAFAMMDVATMPDLSMMQVRARLHDVDEGAIAVGMRAECVLDAYPGQRLAATVESISPMARPEGRDAVRRIFYVVLALSRTDPAVMLPGMSVRVEVIRRKVDQALLVPRHLLHAGGTRATVRLASGREEPVEIEFCGLTDCAVRTGPPEGTALAAPPPSGRQPS
jgi:multidrug efflux pump subunit AcrA (membrane-fusion protein)